MERYNMLGVAVTAKCPNKCEICGIKYRKDNLNPGTLRSCIDEVCGMGFRSFGVSGGEPVENKNTLRMIEYASSSGLSCHLTTSGAYAKSKKEGSRKAQEFKDAGLDNLRLSVDMDHSKSVPFQNWVNAIRGAVKVDIPTSLVCTYRNGEWERNAVLLYLLGRELGAQIDSNQSSNCFLMEVDGKEIKAKYSDLYRVGRARGLDRSNFKLEKTRVDQICTSEKLLISNTGELLPCCNFYAWENQEQFSLGNIERSDITSMIANMDKKPIGALLKEQDRSLVEILRSSEDPRIRGMAESEYSGLCEMCSDVFTDPEASKFVSDTIKS